MLGVGVYGINGHQIQNNLRGKTGAKLVAIAGIDRARVVPEVLATDVKFHATLDELLRDPRVELVSICSPRRADQANDAIRALAAGKHVYSEKPCALTEAELDRVLEAARAAKREFREMGGTAFEAPFAAMATIVRDGIIGEIVQVFAQKSYPMRDSRPQDEDVDGGLIPWVGIHGVRMIEQVSGHQVAFVDALQTDLGNPRRGQPGAGLQMAAVLMMRLDNGAVAACIANYLNPKGFGHHGNEHLRIFGTLGMVEVTDAGTRHRLVVGGEDRGPLDVSAAALDYFDLFTDSLQGGKPMPMKLEDELHSTRIVLRARDAARAHAR